MEFHVSRAARERYGFEEQLFSLTGNIVFADFAASRRFAQKMNARRDLKSDPGLAVRAGDLNAMGLIDEVLHYVVALYRRQQNPQVLVEALETLDARLGSEVLEATLRAFTEQFPSLPVLRGELSATEYLASETDGVSNREIALEELLLLWLANGNPSFAPFGELFDDRPLEEGSAYDAVIRGLEAHFKDQPRFGPDDDDLLTLLRRPAMAAETLPEQLAWLRKHWGFVLDRFADRLAVSLDVLEEEERAGWMRFHATQGGAADGGTGDTSALHGFAGLESDAQRFSSDSDWMPRLVLLAKSTYVWLDQLARSYGRPIWRLDQIPDEELDRLARQGFSGLWLIGLWERSHASQRIKQLRGNPEAVASAYSLMDYGISEDLGGEESYRDLRDRAWSRGLRLASDMVPNHMGIDSRWVVEHPEWFMTRADPPYPAYTYDGPNLSSDERVGIYLEDHYYDNTDAAVTFKRVDRWSDETRYIYHGNDGTSMPWNDTAQLDYLKAEVREAVIQTILHVARLFPVIRFDAAMTLARKHIARLWFPEPGSGGAIPSRAEYAMSRAEFDRAMPIEFWRDVVDRVAEEAPDTLLLAEAFWLMEGYFVRTLGMHRVYNSAFMNMLRDEKNAEYRLVVKNTLEFDPQILKRYVNFMNNPDERTAVDQFDKGDKYFGVCTLMVTMPGLPMFGHGQVEGFGERYGMEFRRPQLQEQPDPDLLARHEREIFPLLHRRELFAEVDDFLFYDFETSEGTVNEDVFAYTNRRGHERTLIVYHNRFSETRGWIRRAVGREGRGIADGLSLSDDPARYLVLRDQRTGLEYLHNQPELAARGLFLELAAYQCHVFLEIREVHDDDGRYAALATNLGGRGVSSVEDELALFALEPLRRAFASLVSPEMVDTLTRARRRGGARDGLPGEAGELARTLGREASAILGESEATAVEEFVTDVQAGGAAYLGIAERVADATAHAPATRADGPGAGDDTSEAAAILCWLALRGFGGGPDVPDRSERCRARIDEWRLAEIIAGTFVAAGLTDEQAWRAVEGVRAIVSLPAWRQDTRPPMEAAAETVHGWLADDAVRRFVGVNEHDGITWFERAGFSRLVDWAAAVAMVRYVEAESTDGLRAGAEAVGPALTAFGLADLPRIRALSDALRRLADAAGYRVDGLPTGRDEVSPVDVAPSRDGADD